MPAKALRGILVTADDPRYLEQEIKPEADVFRLDQLNVRELRERYREKQRHFTTSPFDPHGNLLRFFPGGFTIWSGEPGAGKTTLLRQLACHLLHQDLNVFVCSLEEEPEDVFVRHACTALGTENPSEDGLQWCGDVWMDKLKIWNYSGRESDAEHARIFAAVRLLARDHGVRHAVVDSFMCLDVPANDIEQQRKFAGKLAQTCHLSGVHLHLVAHPRKRSRSDQAHTQEDVAGSADLARKADNIVFVKRAANETSCSTQECTPMSVSIFKQRFGTGRTGDAAGWYNRIHRQFVHDQFQTEPNHYLPDMAYERRIAQDVLV